MSSDRVFQAQALSYDNTRTAERIQRGHSAEIIQVQDLVADSILSHQQARPLHLLLLLIPTRF